MNFARYKCVGNRVVRQRTVKIRELLCASERHPAIDVMMRLYHLKVDEKLLRFVVGKGGSTKAKIEAEQGVSLRIPRPEEAKKDSTIEIIGDDEAVISAEQEILKIVDEAVQNKLQYTHFLSLPLAVHPTLLEQVLSFQEICTGHVSSSDEDDDQKDDLSSKKTTTECNEAEDLGISKSIFVKPKTFHLTIQMLKLWNEDRIQAASELLQNTLPVVYKSLDNRPISIQLKGVECLRGAPDKAHVLYACVEESEDKSRLLQVCQTLIDSFVEAGLVLEKDIGKTLTLHATLMNTTNRKRAAGQRANKRVPFDAKGILEKYRDHNWGCYRISEMHLSERFAYDENGYYHCVSSIPFP